MPKLLNDFIRPVTPSQIKGETTYLPEVVDSDSIFPGMVTLSRQEVDDISARVFLDYVTTNQTGGVPLVDLMLKNLSWLIFAYAYEVEADIRESNGEMFEAQLLRDTVELILDTQDAEIDAVLDAGHLLTTSEVLKAVQQDILNIVLQNRLAVSYHDAAEWLHYESLPKVGFSSMMA